MVLEYNFFTWILINFLIIFNRFRFEIKQLDCISRYCKYFKLINFTELQSLLII